MKRPHVVPGLAAAVLAFALVAPGCGGDEGGGAQKDTGAAPAGSAPASPAGEGPAAAKEAVTVLESYDRGLDYLLTLQKDGVWDAKPGTPSAEFTSMAVAAVLGRPTGVREKDKAVAQKAVDFLASQVEEDGSVRNGHEMNYAVSVMVMALTASGRDDVKPAIDRCVGKIRQFQFLEKDNTTYGGVGYGSDKTRSDLSNTQFALASLRAAGVSSDDPVYQEAVAFLDRTQNRKENETDGEPAQWTDKDGKVYVRANDGGANYRPGDSKAGFDERPDGTRVLRSYGSMTYALLRCYHLAGLTADDGRVKAAADWIARNWTLDRNPGMPEKQAGDGVFYMYATMGKTLPLAGIDTIDTPKGPVDWRKALAAKLAETQRPDGSWLNEHSSRWEEGNPLLATAFALTALAPCHR